MKTWTPEFNSNSCFNPKSTHATNRSRSAYSLLIPALACVLLTPVAMARVHSNSMSPRPDNLHLADINGDGLAEWIGHENDTTYGGYVISVAHTDPYATPLFTIDQRYRSTGHTETVFKLFTGHFLYPGEDSACIYTNTGHVKCFYLPAGSSSPYWYSDQASSTLAALMNREVLVGDFDGDGLDEILLYDRWSAAIDLWKYNSTDRQFEAVPTFAPGNFGEDAAYIAGSPIVLVGDFADWGDGRRDDLAVCNSGGQVVRYDARKDSLGRTTFWKAFASNGAYSCSPYNVSVADVTGWGLESLVIRDSTNGTVRFLDMRSIPSSGLLKGYLLPVDTYWSAGSVNQGQIGSGDGYLIWAKMSRWPGESGTNTRDDVFLFGSASAALSRYDARYYAPTLTYTYWWGYTQPLSYLLTRMFSWAAL